MIANNPNTSKNETIWEFNLYINGDTHENKWVEKRLRKICDHSLDNSYKIHVFDINKVNSLPSDLLAVPTIIRTFPLPERRIIGNLSSEQRAIEGLGLRKHKK